MKKRISLSLLFLAFAFFIIAQADKTSGKIQYESIRKVEVKLQGDAAQFENMLPKEHKSMKELIFNQDVSLYQNIEKKQDDEVSQEMAGGGMVMVKMAEPEEFIFCDIKSKQNLEQREFMSRKFLIESKTDTVQWKLTGNQKMILDLACMEAELIGSAKKTIAWFSPQIPVSTGPDGYVGLPGLILALDIDNGKTSIIAKSIEFKQIDSREIAKPSEGRKVTKAGFNKIVEEKKKEMGGQQGTTIFIRSN